MKKTVLSFLVMGFTLFYSCRKEMERPYWDTEILAPLINTSLNIDNLLPDSVLQTNADSSMKIVYEGDIYKISMDTLFKIEDTTIQNSFNIPVTYKFGPGDQVINNNITETTYDLGGPQLKTIIIKRGYVRFKVNSLIKEKVDFIYKIPCATLSGAMFQINVTVPAAIGSSPGIYDKTYDLSGYTFDLTGLTNNKINTIYTSLSALVNPDGDSVVVTPADFLTIDNTFYEMFPRYAKGYFGNNTFNIGPEQTDFTMFERIADGTIQLEDVDFNLSIENPIGLDSRVYMNNLKSVNTRTGNSIDLVNSIIGTPININRAAESGITIYPTYANFPLTTSNSNIKPMMENLPDKFGYSMQIITNPMGNVSGSNDFIYSDQLLKAKMRMEIPLSLIATNLTLVDTLDLNIQNPDGSQNIHSGSITLLANNGFPLDASIQLYMLDDNYQITDSLYTYSNTIIQAPVNSSLRAIGKKPTKIISEISENKMKLLYNTRKVKLKVKFNTLSQTQYVKIYSDYNIDIKLIGDINYTIHLQ